MYTCIYPNFWCIYFFYFFANYSIFCISYFRWRYMWIIK